MGVSLLFSVPPSIDNNTVSENNLTVIVDAKLVIDCPVKGIPPPEVTWYKNTVLLTSNVNITISNGGRRLEIFKARVSDTAVYRCTGTNDAGDTNMDFNVEVHGKYYDLMLSCQV